MRTRISFSAIFARFLVVSPIFQLVRCDSTEDATATEVVRGGDSEIVRYEADEDGPAPNVNAICIFPKNPGRVVRGGKFNELLVGVHNEGKLPLNIHLVYATLHLPFDHRLSIQNLTVQPGSFDLVGRIMVEFEEYLYLHMFYNGTIEVVESEGFLSGESVLITLGVGLLALLGFLFNGPIHHFCEKTKKAPEVEVGTGISEVNMDEWLEGTAYTRSVSGTKKEHKRKK